MYFSRCYKRTEVQYQAYLWGTVTCSTETRWPPSCVHPISFHPLHQSQRRHGDFVVLLTKLQHVSEAGDVQARVCR